MGFLFNIKDYCRELWDEMDEKGIEKNTDTYNYYMHSITELQVEKLWSEMDIKGIEKKASSYDIYMDKLGLKEDEFLIQEMKNKGIARNEGVTSKYFHYVENSLGIWNEMDEKGIAKDTQAYNIYMRKLNVEAAKKIWKEMDKKKINKNTETYNIYMSKVGLSEVNYLWKEMDKKRISKDVNTYNVFFKKIRDSEILSSSLKRFIKDSKGVKIGIYPVVSMDDYKTKKLVESMIKNRKNRQRGAETKNEKE